MAISKTSNTAANLNDDVENTSHRFRGELRHAAEVVSDASRKVRSAFNSATGEISHASEVATTEIRTNPVRSSIVALGAGLLLGMLLKR